MSSQNERESGIEITYLDYIIDPPEIPIISNDNISTLQSQSTMFPSSEESPNSDEDFLVNPPFPPKIDPKVLAIGLLNREKEDLLVNPPFPPNIEPKVLAAGLINRQKKSKKMLNEFFIYRGEYVRELKRLNIRPKQTKVSSLASASWHSQPPDVKDEYRRLARETEKLFMAESRIRSLKDSSVSPTLNPDNFQLPSQTSQLELEQQMSNLQTNPIFTERTYHSNYSNYPNDPNILWPSYLRSTPTTPYMVNPTSYYHNAETIVPSQSAQEADFFTNYHQTRK